MATQFTPCPACGAVGEVGSNCQFCGTTIILKEGATFSDARIIKQRTITPQQYAEKISIYHNIEGLCEGVSKVSIGEQEGIVNLNGDLIYPLGNERISKGFHDSIVRIGNKYLNIENFEYVDDPYLNKTLLKKIITMSEAITDNPSTLSRIYIGWGKDGERVGFTIDNAAMMIEDNPNDWTPQLMLNIDFKEYLCSVTDREKYYNRFVSCEDFELFKTVEEYNLNGEVIPPIDRNYYIFYGNDTESCCRTILKVLNHIYNIHPNDISNDILCEGEIFGEKAPIQSSSNTSSNSGCAGMLALMLGIGGASVYGIVELISRFIA